MKNFIDELKLLERSFDNEFNFAEKMKCIGETNGNLYVIDLYYKKHPNKSDIFENLDETETNRLMWMINHLTRNYERIASLMSERDFETLK